MVFDANSPRYRTCCCHVRVCTIVIGVLELFGLIGQLVNACIRYSKGDADIKPVTTPSPDHADHAASFALGAPTAGSLAGSIISVIVGLIVVILLFVAVWKQHHLFLIPHLVFQILSIVAMIAVVVLSIIGAIAIGVNYKDADEGALFILLAVLAAVLIVAVIIEIWFFVVVLKCYRFLRDQRAAGEYGGPDVAARYYKA